MKVSFAGWFGSMRARADARARIDRLEIENRRLRLALDCIDEDLIRLSARLTAAQGRVGGNLGGRPSRSKLAARGTQLDLIPKGDKTALREFFRLNPPLDKDREH